MASILIAEDARLQQVIIQKFVESEHSVAGVVSDADGAVEFVNEHAPDVVLMDISLVDGDGITAAREIKAQTPETAVIISTAQVSRDIKRMAREIPIESYLVKPYSKEALLDAIDDALS